jgi:hypothetical protein
VPVSTREERRAQRKAERVAAQKRVARGEATRRWVVIGGIGAIVVVAAIVIFLLSRQGGPSFNQPALGSVPGEQHFDDAKTASGQLYEHIPETTPITADPDGHYPPVFGNHYPTWRPPGVYDSAIPEGYFIHDLEHGSIVVLYNCPNGCQDAVTQLRGMLTSLPRSKDFPEVKLVVSPNTKIQHQFALLAWDWEKDMDSFDADTVRAFYLEHVDRGPEHAGI